MLNGREGRSDSRREAKSAEAWEGGIVGSRRPWIRRMGDLIDCGPQRKVSVSVLFTIGMRPGRKDECIRTESRPSVSSLSTKNFVITSNAPGNASSGRKRGMNPKSEYVRAMLRIEENGAMRTIPRG